MVGKEPQFTVIIGALLIVISLLSGVLSGFASVTIFIPAIIGALLLALGWLARTPARTRTMMHLVAVLALFGMLGSLNVVPALIDLAAGTAPSSMVSVVARSSMLLLCGGLLAVCIASFVRARRMRAGT